MALNAGPLTTIFTPPTTCLDVVTSGQSPDYPSSYSMFVGHFGVYYEPALHCSPSAKVLINFFTNDYYWSPGYCPSGYTTACSYTPINFEPTVTASLCCPIGFDCVSVWPHVCSSHPTASLTNVWKLEGTTEIPPPSYNFITKLPNPALVVWNDGVPVVWESTDTAILDLITSGTNARAAPTISSPPTILSPPTVAPTNVPVQTTIGFPVPQNSSGSSESSGLSKTTIIIIAVVVGGVSIIVGILTWFRCRRNMKVRKVRGSGSMVEHTITSPRELPDDTMRTKLEADSTPRHELSSGVDRSDHFNEGLLPAALYEIGDAKRLEMATLYELDSVSPLSQKPPPSLTKPFRMYPKPTAKIVRKPIPPSSPTEAHTSPPLSSDHSGTMCLSNPSTTSSANDLVSPLQPAGNSPPSFPTGRVKEPNK